MTRNKAKWDSSVTWLVAIVLIFTGWHALSFFFRLSEWHSLQTLALTIHPILFVSSALLWASLGLIAIAAIVLRKSWTTVYIRYAAIIFGIVYFVDTIAQKDVDSISTLTFVGIFGLLIWALSQAGTRTYFGEHNEQ